MEKLINLYRQWAGEEPAEVIKLAEQGSNRQYFRIIKQDGDTVIGVVGTSRDEDHAFIYLANHFNLRQLPVPKILAVSEDQLCYIQTDLGELRFSMLSRVVVRLEEDIIRRRRNF